MILPSVVLYSDEIYKPNYLETPYFAIDFSNSKTVFWNEACSQNLSGTLTNCEFGPTYVEQYNFNTDDKVPYTDQAFGGYLTSGNITY